jgi:hypothetical protein
MSAATKPRLQVVGKTKRFKSVEIAERRENHDAWELADAIYEDILSEVPERQVATRGANDPTVGIKDAAERVYDAHTAAGTEIGLNYVRQMFDTVRVWPAEDRLPDKASFVVHSELRGKDYPNRREVIQKLAAKSESGRLSWSDLRRWKSERKPTPFKTFLQIAEERIRRAVHDAGKPWHMVAGSDREEIVSVLRTIANEIEAETFA